MPDQLSGRPAFFNAAPESTANILGQGFGHFSPCPESGPRNQIEGESSKTQIRREMLWVMNDVSGIPGPALIFGLPGKGQPAGCASRQKSRGKIFDCPDIGFLRLVALPVDAHVLDHPPTRRAHLLLCHGNLLSSD